MNSSTGGPNSHHQSNSKSRNNDSSFMITGARAPSSYGQSSKVLNERNSILQTSYDANLPESQPIQPVLSS
jgi:hypothetical protein